jgi:hypothetical protein
MARLTKRTVEATHPNVLNPKGRNQYTYRRDAEAIFDKLLRSIDPKSGKSVGEQILEGLLELAKAREEWAVQTVLARILPKVERLEHSGAIELAPSASDALIERLAKLAAAQR